MTTEISADAVIYALATRSGGSGADELRENLRAIWASVAADLKPEEACVILWSLNPGAIVGTSDHRAAMARVARAMYPSDAPGRAVSRLRRVMARPSVRAVLDAMRAEETLFAMAQRAQMRSMLVEIATSTPPVGEVLGADGTAVGAWEPKDIIALQRVRLAAMAQWSKLDNLDAPPPVAEQADIEPAEKRKKLLDKVKALIPSCRGGV